LIGDAANQGRNSGIDLAQNTLYLLVHGLPPVLREHITVCGV
jgi:hypothetical protein